MSDHAPPPTVWPTLAATDAHALIAFLVDVFGFRTSLVVDDGDRVAHAELAWPEGGGVMLGSVKSEGSWKREAGTAGIYVVTADPDAVYGRAAAAGVEIVQEPHDTDYGGREMAVRDAEGNLWSFGTYRGTGG